MLITKAVFFNGKIHARFVEKKQHTASQRKKEKQKITEKINNFSNFQISDYYFLKFRFFHFFFTDRHMFWGAIERSREAIEFQKKSRPKSPSRKKYRDVKLQYMKIVE